VVLLSFEEESAAGMVVRRVWCSVSQGVAVCCSACAFVYLITMYHTEMITLYHTEMITMYHTMYHTEMIILLQCITLK